MFNVPFVTAVAGNEALSVALDKITHITSEPGKLTIHFTGGADMILRDTMAQRFADEFKKLKWIVPPTISL